MAVAKTQPDELDAAKGLARFKQLHEQLEPHLERLLVCEPHSRSPTPGAKHVPVPHAPGVYLFTEDGNHRYIGRAKDLNHRFGQHVAAGGRHNQAAFAFNIAKRAAEQAGIALVGVKREDLDVDPEFNERFFAPAKVRVRAMEFRYVLFGTETPDVDALSTIFEVYASMRLGTEGDFNLFATH
jgi:hypothetical protein